MSDLPAGRDGVDAAGGRAGPPRAGIVVTGTEVLSGRVSDRNGPWLSERLAELGVDHAYTTIVADRPQDIEAALRFMSAHGMDIVLTSGGLGPTADDMTAAVVGRFQGREMVLDEALSQRIAEIVAPLARRWTNIDPQAMRAANHKQATVPAGATVLEPVGTAPGLVVGPGEPGARSDDRRAPRAAARASTDVARGDLDRRAARGAGRRDLLRAAHDAAVRHPRVRDRRDAARRRGAGGASWSAWRSPRASNAARSRS